MGWFSRNGRDAGSSVRSTESAKAGALARLAGLSGSPRMEELEDRRLLFTASIGADQVDPATGLGITTVYFGYSLPYLISGFDIPDPQEPQTVVEDFNNEDYGPRGSGNGAAFDQSNVVPIHNIFPPADFAVTSANPGDAQDQERWLRVALTNGESFSFSPRTQQDATLPLPSTRVQITFRANGGGDASGLDLTRVRVDLFLGDQIIDTLAGAELANAFQGNDAFGTGILDIAAPAATPAFDRVRITQTADFGLGDDPAFQVDDVTFTTVQGRFAQLVGGQIFGAVAVLTGPVGAQVTITDLRGEDMRATYVLGAIPGSQVTFIDPDDNGIPNFNYGIGAIRISGTDMRSTFSLWGGTIQTASELNPDDEDFTPVGDQGFAFQLIDEPVGVFDDFEQAGFGYVFNADDGEVTVGGLPGGVGSVVVGAPFVRNFQNNLLGSAIGNSNIADPELPTVNFRDPNQGVFVGTDATPASIGTLNIHGVLHGSSRVTGAANKISVGYLVGTMAVDGDAGAMYLSSDAGSWTIEPDFDFTQPVQADPIYRTRGEIIVGRTLGELAVAGRLLSDVRVIGDVNSPRTRTARDNFVYDEVEFVDAWNTQTEELTVLRDNLYNNSFFNAQNAGEFVRTGGQAIVWGQNYYRNDTIMSAEFVGGATAGVRIRGDISGRNPFLGEDRADVYAFAVDGNTEVFIQGAYSQAQFGPYFRVVDQDGRTVTAPRGPDDRSEQARFQTSFARFTPSEPGVYYLVVSDPNADDDGEANVQYTFAITGLAPVTAGSIRSGAGTGFGVVNTGQGEANSIDVLFGGMGLLRVGVGAGDEAGEDAETTDLINTEQGADDSSSFQGGIFNIQGSLWGILTGGDIGSPRPDGTGTRIDINIGGDLGGLYTGRSPVVGGSPEEGDVNDFTLRVGGRVGTINISGGIGIDQDNENDPRGAAGAGITLLTGRRGGNGDIGLFRVGSHVETSFFRIDTSPGSTIGALLVAQDVYDDLDDPRAGFWSSTFSGFPRINTFSNSDVLFVDAPRIDWISNNRVDPIVGGNAVRTYVDDAGASVTISVGGVADGTNVGQIITVPVDPDNLGGSQGVVVAQITVNLPAGATLDITALTGNGPGGGGGPIPGRIGIGRIIVTGEVGSSVNITGQVEVDVYRVEVVGAVDRVSNVTPGGDIVTIDAESVTDVDIDGDLGTTQLPSFGPDQIAERPGIDGGGPNGTVRGPVGLAWDVDAGTIDNDYNGNVYRPVSDDEFVGGNAFLDDIGSPVDGYLAGLVVRTGNVNSVSVGGRVVNILLQDAAGVLTTVTVNDDEIVPLGQFHGIEGVVYAFNVGDVFVGDGIAPRRDTPVGIPGVFAANNIGSVRSNESTVRRATIGGAITAANVTQEPPIDDQTVDGLNILSFPGGTIDRAFISSGTLDEFWTSFNFGEERISAGDLGQLDLTNGLLRASSMQFRDIETAGDPTAVFDASVIDATGRIGSLDFRRMFNSTTAGSEEELLPARVLAGRDVDRVTVVEDVTDVNFAFAGDLREAMSATDWVRAQIGISNRTASFVALRDIRGTTFIGGQLDSATAGNNVASSTFSISGPIIAMAAANRFINARIEVTGPSGRIDAITAANGFDGEISATGPVSAVTVTNGDLEADIVTTTEDGDVGTLTASRDVVINTNISGGLNTVTAGRHIGRLGRADSIVAGGQIGAVTAPAGQLYSDVRAGEGVTTVALGGATAKPGNDQTGRGSIIAFGTIGSVTVTNGDFGGDIVAYTGGITGVTITNGSLLPGRVIAAHDSSIGTISIQNGNLLGSVYADEDINSLTVTGTGAFGNVGVDTVVSQFTSADSRRNQLPIGVTQLSGADGPTIFAGRSIRTVAISNGVFEAGFHAGRTIDSITIGGRVANNSDFGRQQTFFAAGDAITNISIAQSAADALFIAGLLTLGADNRPGGGGANADLTTPGTITRVGVGGGTFGVSFVAGAQAGANGVYGDGDDVATLGSSSIQTLAVSGTVSNTVAAADNLSSSVANDARFTRRSLGRSDLDQGGAAGTPIGASQQFTVGGTTYTVAFTGPGQAFFQALPIQFPANPAQALARITLRGTTSGSTLTLSSSTGVIDAVQIISSDEASLGALNVTGRLSNASRVIIDGGVQTLNLSGGSAAAKNGTLIDFNRTPRIDIGGDVQTFTASNFTGGFVTARAVQSLGFTGDFGTSDANESGLQFLSLGTASFAGGLRGRVSVDRDIGGVTVGGSAERAQLRAGDSIASVSIAGQANQLVVSAGDDIGPVTIGGNMTDSSINAGADLGRDAFFDGTGANADRLTSGNVGQVMVGGNFRESDITAGVLRGPDKFFGTADDLVAPGRGSIAGVTIIGTQVGSSRSSESYRIVSNGTIGPVTLGGQQVVIPIGNFAVERERGVPIALRVTDIRVASAAGVVTASVFFNQQMDAASLSTALSVSEVRGQGEIEVRLVEGPDYTLRYNDAANRLDIIFSRNVTEANLPQVSGVPGPGVYRIRFDQDVARGRIGGLRFDGDNDGLIEPGDDFGGEVTIGDVGDKITPQRITLPSGRIADLYGPANLNYVFDSSSTPDGLADPNQTFTIRGVIGDHPDHDVNFFRVQGDVDLYRVTLQAGQILKLGALRGGAARANVQLLDAAGNPAGFLADNAAVTSFPVPAADPSDISFASVYLIKITGDYIIAVGDASEVATDDINNPLGVSGTIGEYELDVTIFDDGDSGFNSQSPSGDGTTLSRPPEPINFAGADQVFGTPDDTPVVTIGDFNFTLNGARTVVTGTNGDGSIVITRAENGTVTTSVQSAIGPRGAKGRPDEVFADVDVYHLNGRQPIAPGTQMRMTLRLTETGSDIGSLQAASIQDAIGAVQFSLFDTTNATLSSSTDIEDADLVFSPTDFRPYGGAPNTVIATNGTTTYGFDASGDFYIDFVLPPALGTANGAGTFAAYVQGVVNSDYRLEVVQRTTTAASVRQRQNFLLEVEGGTVDWLEASGRTTTLRPFSAAGLGFVGSATNNQPVDEYVTDSLVAALNDLFQNIDTNNDGITDGLDVVFSTNPADFENQDFSTIYLSTTNDPINFIFDSFTAFNFLQFFAPGNINAAFNSTQPMGISERSDPFNTDLRDEAVVFTPALGILGLDPGQEGLDQLVSSLTGAVARRAGELMGARITADNGPDAEEFDPFAADSVSNAPASAFAFEIPDASRSLSTGLDSIERTNFFLGRQRAYSLLLNNVARRF
ncbi:MAG TPA: hypothetical protein VD971_06605 [Phycisphaerales bacterium]|nr:hypothetical protein [Phycisphaerales bacterium]